MSAETERKSAHIFVNVWTIRVLEGGPHGGLGGVRGTGPVRGVREYDVSCTIHALDLHVRYMI